MMCGKHTFATGAESTDRGPVASRKHRSAERALGVYIAIGGRNATAVKRMTRMERTSVVLKDGKVFKRTWNEREGMEWKPVIREKECVCLIQLSRPKEHTFYNIPDQGSPGKRKPLRRVKAPLGRQDGVDLYRPRGSCKVYSPLAPSRAIMQCTKWRGACLPVSLTRGSTVR